MKLVFLSSFVLVGRVLRYTWILDFRGSLMIFFRQLPESVIENVADKNATTVKVLDHHHISLLFCKGDWSSGNVVS